MLSKPRSAQDRKDTEASLQALVKAAQDRYVEAFCKVAKELGYEIDEGLMMTWFCRALSRGYGEAISRTQPVLATKDEEIARLREALEPFAAYGDYINTYFADHDGTEIAGGNSKNPITISDFRRARAALRDQQE